MLGVQNLDIQRQQEKLGTLHITIRKLDKEINIVNAYSFEDIGDRVLRDTVIAEIYKSRVLEGTDNLLGRFSLLRRIACRAKFRKVDDRYADVILMHSLVSLSGEARASAPPAPPNHVDDT